MTRQAKNTVDYFPHDAHACSGDTVTILQNRFKNDGYAAWFKLLEKLSSTDDHYLDCSNPIKWQLLIAHLGLDEITTVDIINLLVEMQAIDKTLWDSRIIWCQNLVNNLADVYKNRRRELPQKPLNIVDKPITTVEKGISTIDKPLSTEQSRVEYSKVNNSKVNNIKKDSYGEFNNVFLSKEEYSKLLSRYGEALTKEKIERLSCYMTSKGRKYRNHYATILNWSDNNGGNHGKDKPNNQTDADDSRPGLRAWHD